MTGMVGGGSMLFDRIIKLFFSLMLLSGVFLAFSQQVEEVESARQLLSMSLDDLLNVEVITASKTSEKLSDAPGVLAVVTRDELQRFGGTTLKDILERVPSLTGTTAYFTDRTMIAARGAQIKFTAGHILILLNGRPVREVVEGGVSTDIFESFPVNVIEKIEVIKGPGSVLYGSNAFSAVINIITETAEENRVKVTTRAGENGAFGTSGRATIRSHSFSMVAAAQHLKKADWDLTYSGINYFTTTGIPDLHVRDITVKNSGYGGYLGMNYKNLSLMSSFTGYKSPYYNQGFIGDNRWKRGFTNLAYQIRNRGAWEMDFNVTYTWLTMHATDFPWIHRTSNDVVAEWTNYIRPCSRLYIILGGLFNYIKGKELYYSVDPEVLVSDDQRASYGIYSQIDYQLFQNLKIISGFQANKVKSLDVNIVPRVGAIWYPIPRINIKALYSEAFRAPSINEIGIFFEGDPGFKGNPELLPEKVQTTDLGINYLGDHIQLGVNYFSSKQSNIIVIDFKPQSVRYENLGEMEFKGVEFEGKYYVTRSLFITGSALYQTNKDKYGNKNVTPLANHSGKAGVSYMSDNGFTIGIFNIYQGLLDDYYTSSKLTPKAGVYNLLNLYSRLNINQFFKLSSPYDIAVFLQGDNLLNKELWLPNHGGAFSETIPVNRGRTIYLGVNISI